MNHPDLFDFSSPAPVPIGARRPRTPGPKEAPAGHVRILGHCPVRKCKVCKAFNLPVKIETLPRTRPFGFMQWPQDQREQWEKEIGANYTATVLQWNCQPDEICPEHKHRLSWHQVDGNLSEGTKCDPRCTGARGPNCDCQCGGANHGSDYL